MSKFSELKSRLAEYKPTIGTAYLTYIDVRETPPPGSTHQTQYTHLILTSSEHEIFPKIGTKSMRRVAAPRLDSGDWYAIVILSEGEVAAYFWMALRAPRNIFSGVINVNLLPEEGYGFDLYVKPEHRRGSLGNYVADIAITDLKGRGLRYGYTHLLYDNIPSVFWHDGVGFNVAQIFNFFSFGPRIMWKIPLSESPRYGPLSRKGRYNDPDPKDAFGGSLLPK